jgi:hypothetical protein
VTGGRPRPGVASHWQPGPTVSDSESDRIISASPEPMVTARLGQMVTLSPRRLVEQPLRRLSGWPQAQPEGPGQAPGPPEPEPRSHQAACALTRRSPSHWQCASLTGSHGTPAEPWRRPGPRLRAPGGTPSAAAGPDRRHPAARRGRRRRALIIGSVHDVGPPASHRTGSPCQWQHLSHWPGCHWQGVMMSVTWQSRCHDAQRRPQPRCPRGRGRRRQSPASH